ncbi:hypothetical protein P154DRAFT_527515 [Amniculicola lignicola CBS 123094]|uniref:Uncharacterized protein n=1 Tax=Amniculicola lignicola CBS 123094 TaxID=1392246 RepID=A0A6A5VXP0_9PLEO|nr:hypothetical protein P154DRAFT_527515 [Amniculicola lignicola CBS 123094]
MINVQSVVLFAISYFIIPRLTFLPKSVHSLIILFGPFLLPRLVNFFNTARATSRSVPIRPVPPKVQRALNLLFLSAVCSLVLTLPKFAPENIFIRTQSRLQIAPDTLFARLRLLRPLTDEDESLRSKFQLNGQNKLLYLVFGPDTLLNCIWCATPDGNDFQNYLLYSLPKIVTPHIFHLGVLGLATSSLIGAEGSRFRTHVTVAGLCLVIAETWFFANYDLATSKRAKVLQEVDFAHWRIRMLRYLAFAVVDIALGLVLWTTSTNRWLAKPENIAQRLEMTTRKAEDTLNKLRGLGLLTNSINRDQQLRGLKEEYWRTEGQVMAETVQEEEVMDEINRVVGTMDLRSLEGRVGEVADGILAGIDGMRASQVLSSSALSDGPASQ